MRKRTFDWKYSLVLVDIRSGKEICQIYELYQDTDGDWTLFANAFVDSVEDVEKLYENIKTDGINRWFYENGDFLYNAEKERWEWEVKK